MSDKQEINTIAPKPTKNNLVYRILVYILVLSIGSFVLQTIAREFGLPEYVKPFFYLQWFGTFVETLYTYLGKFFGYIFYWLFQFFWMISERLFSSIKETFVELYYAIRPYFNLYLIWEAAMNIVWDFWYNHYIAICIGFFICIGIVLICALVYFIKQGIFNISEAPNTHCKKSN